MSHRAKLGGIFPPVMTPFKNQRVNLRALAHNIEKMNGTPLIGYMPLGSNGEFRSLDDRESLAVVRTVKKHAAPDKTLMIGCARESAYSTAEFAKRVAAIGVDYASVLSPYYFASKMDDKALIAYFTYVADNSPIPILMYCAPKFAAGVVISQDAVRELSQHPNIVGMKDTSQEDIASYVNAVPDGAEFYVLAGSITKFMKGLKAGAIGGVLSVANYLPEECCRIQALFESGDVKAAEALSDSSIAFNKITTAKSGVSGVKAAMDLLGYKGLEPRLPLFPFTKEERADLKAVFKEHGYLD